MSITLITLIAPHNNHQASDLPAALAALGGEVQCIHPATAWDIRLKHPLKRQLTAWREAAHEQGMDCIIQPEAHRLKRLLLSDMDSTIIEQECVDELAGFVGLKDEVSDITEQAMRGEIEFEDALQQRVALLKGLSTDVVAQLLKDGITLSGGAKTLIQTLRAHGTRCILVSGGFTLFTEAIAQLCGFHDHASNILLQKRDVLTGEVALPIMGQDAKLERLEQELNTLKIPTQQSMAIGDGANDLPMLRAAGLGIAYRAKPAVREAIDNQINYTDLTALLHASGIPPEKWSA